MSHNPVLLSFGGNLGEVAETFRTALLKLERGGFRTLRESALFHSKAMGCEEGAPDFLNRSVLGIWEGEALDLLNLLQRIEVEAGRPADHPHWVSRPLDIDIVLMGDTVIRSPRLTVPHPELSKRDFVLVPSAEIASEMIVPGPNLSLHDLLNFH